MYEDVQRTVQFLTNYARENALVLPGRVPGFKKDDIDLLPSSHTKVFVYSRYKESLEGTGNYDFKIFYISVNKEMDVRTTVNQLFTWMGLLPFQYYFMLVKWVDESRG